MFVPTKNSGTAKTRIKYMSLMYLVFITLWADGLIEIDKAKDIIAEQEAYIAIHQALTDDYDEALATIDVLNADIDTLNMKANDNKLMHMAKNRYIYNMGYKVDWVTAINDNDYIKDLTKEKILFDE